MTRYTTDFKRWCNSAPTEGHIVDTLHIHHPRFGAVWLARSKLPFAARLESGRRILFKPASFAIDFLPKERSTQQRISASIDGLDGGIYRELKRLSAQDRQNPIRVTHRTYLSNRPNRPVITPPPVLEVSSVEGGYERLNFDLQPQTLPNLRMGVYYLLHLYRGLVNV